MHHACGVIFQCLVHFIYIYIHLVWKLISYNILYVTWDCDILQFSSLMATWKTCLLLCNHLLCFFPTRKTASSYRELEERKQRLQKLEKLYGEMALQKELKVSHLLFFLKKSSSATFEGLNNMWLGWCYQSISGPKFL